MSATDRSASRTAPDHRLRADVGGAHGTAKTSTAAAFALVFGVSALVTALTAILTVVSVPLGVIGVILGIVGMKMAREPAVTGRGVAVGGLVLSILALLVAAAFAVGITTVLNDEGAVNRLERQVEDLRDRLPN